MSKPMNSYNTSRVIDSRTIADSNPAGTWKDFLTISKMGIVNSNLITTFTGVWLALKFTNQSFLDNIWKIIFVLLGTALIVAGGCCLNNYIDRDIDKLMKRTKNRPSAAGTLTGKQVLWTGIIMSVLGAVVLLQASFAAAAFGLLGLFVYVVVYTWWLKRTHSINTIVGSISGALPPVIGWAAIDPALSSNEPWILFLIMFLWQPPHFLALAIKYAEEYRRAGIPMLPVVAGFETTKRQMIIYVASLFPASLLLYTLGPWYLAAAIILGLGWIAVSIAGFFMKDTIKWSRIMFVYSLNYMTILFAVMIFAVI
ncbi:protoheme IX farnesyltransferase [Scopulibacillus daqui]|uniref:Protoheme IX farnesyltransferase n=1 Tax=Scopulibacillus daqui TaxID=1469162 RepID=A0ABS2PW40_9BACL|nr:heme o synthase [Scopulibacillus daqui]MBM7644225.1 protoheme IX farnesyltransferase [Scopulibacillus daqui]